MFKGTANITTYLDKLLWYSTTLMLCSLTGTKVVCFFLAFNGYKINVSDLVKETKMNGKCSIFPKIENL